MTALCFTGVTFRYLKYIFLLLVILIAAWHSRITSLSQLLWCHSRIASLHWLLTRHSRIASLHWLLIWIVINHLIYLCIKYWLSWLWILNWLPCLRIQISRYSRCLRCIYDHLSQLCFWDEKSEPEKNDFWESQDVLTAPKHKGKLSKRTIASMFLILILIPVTIWTGITLFDDRKYFVISLAIAVYCMLPFFLIFEGRKPQARELLTIAVLVAIAVAGRAAFFMVPSFKPVVAVTII